MKKNVLNAESAGREIKSTGDLSIVTAPFVPLEAVPNEDEMIIESPQLGKIVGIEIAAVDAAKQAELEKAARLAAKD